MHTFSTKLLKSQKMDASLQEKRKQPKKKKDRTYLQPFELQLSCRTPPYRFKEKPLRVCFLYVLITFFFPLDTFGEFVFIRSAFLSLVNIIIIGHPPIGKPSLPEYSIELVDMHVDG